MWKITVSSSPILSSENCVETSLKNRLTIKSTRVCQQELDLPENVYVVCADPAAADLSSSAMFTLSKVPYLFSTACSDGIIRFWSCRLNTITNANDTRSLEEDSCVFEFYEWELNSSMFDGTKSKTSQVNIGGGHFPLAISCSYNSRFAVAFKKNKRKTISKNKVAKHDFIKYCVKIFECESTGGSEWKLEDCIYLKNIVLPEIDSGINFDYIFGNQQPIRPARSTHSFKNIVFGSSTTSSAGPSSQTAASASSSSSSSSSNAHQSTNSGHLATIASSGSFNINNQSSENTLTSNESQNTANSKTPEIPSTAAKISIKRQFSNGNTDSFLNTANTSSCNISNSNNNNNINSNNANGFNRSKLPKSGLIKLDWASNENGSHLLTIGIGNKIFVYSCMTKDLALKSKRQDRAEIEDIDEEHNNDSNANPDDSLLKWIEFRSFELDSADDQQALPTQMKWVREGLLVIGLDTEMQVYSQWSPINCTKQVLDHIEPVADETKTSNSLMMVAKNHSVLDLNKLNNKLTNKENHHLNVPKAEPTRIFDENEMLEMIQDSGLFMQAKHAWPVLPQYHPKLLLELMNSGKINRVKAILMHLTRCIIDHELKIKNKKLSNSAEKNLKQRKMSVCSVSELPEEQTLNYLEIDQIPPLPLFQLYSADNSTHATKAAEQLATKADQGSLFEANENYEAKMDETLDETVDQYDYLSSEQDKMKMLERKARVEKLEFKKSLLFQSSTNENSYFDAKVCKLLIEYLEFVQLNGLSSIDQMYLVALADTVVSVKCDINFDEPPPLQPTAAGSKSKNDNHNNQIVDNCGFKFLLALRSYNYLMRTLPLQMRDKLKSIGLGTANFAWAFHSEFEQELLNQILLPTESVTGAAASLLWPDMRQYGVGWWLKSPQMLRQLIEKIAKCSFQVKSEPLDAALFYLAMKKKGVLWALFKTVKDTKMSDFFKNDFTESKWQTAALKNAFVLLGKQRFEHAAAFFLLAGRLKDAIEVCLRNLHDIQLALVLVRLYCESDFELLNSLIKFILSVEVLGYKQVQLPTSKDVNSFGQLSHLVEAKHVSKDPFLRSMSYWFLKDYKKALYTLYDTDIYQIDQLTSTTGLSHYSSLGNTKDSMISHVFNFYTYLKRHPLVLRQQLSDQADTLNIANIKACKNDKEITPVERRLHFISAYHHLINGCPLLTLDVLSRLPKFIVKNTKKAEDKVEDKVEPKVEAQENNTNAFDWTSGNAFDLKKKAEKSDQVDWSAPSFNNRFQDDELELDLKMSDSEEEKEEKEEEEVKEREEPEKAAESEEESNMNKSVDKFAQQIKFISCLKILIEEMSNLATGFEVTGGQLRYYMYYWLERETQLLRELGDYKGTSETSELMSLEEEQVNDDSSLLYLQNNQQKMSKQDILASSSSSSSTCSATTTSNLLHEQVLNDQKIFHEKIKRLNKRKAWLRSNELLLRTFLSYCSLHSASAQGLTSVKMELVLLMQELVEDRSTTMKQLYEPVPLQTTTTIPLLAASIASSKNILAGPIQMLKSLSIDILSSLSSIHKIPNIFDYPIMISTIKEVSVSLSSCIYQCLCDSDSVAFTCFDEQQQEPLAADASSYLKTIGVGMQELSRNILYKSTYLLKKDESKNRSLKKNSISGKNVSKIDSQPRNWPGISNLAKLLERSTEDQEVPKLKILLYESLVSVYSSLLLNAFVFYDCSNLYRLLSKQWNDQMWNKLFGGASHIEYKYKYPTSIISLGKMNTIDFSIKLNK